MTIQYAIRISPREAGGYLVERLAENEVTDKYVTHDLSILRKSHNQFDEAWKRRVFDLTNQPSAGLPDPPPLVIPPLEPTMEERLWEDEESVRRLGHLLIVANGLREANLRLLEDRTKDLLGIGEAH